MKKLFTLVALLACFLGAKAEWVEDYSIDYSKMTNFTFYVMGYVPEWVDGVMTDYGANYRYETQANLDDDTKDGKWKEGESSVGTAMAGTTEYQKVTGAGPYWHQYFVGDGVQTELGGSYKITAMIKASEETELELQMGWDSWWTGTVVTAKAKVGTEWAEVEWEFAEIGGTSCNIDAKPGNFTGTIEWKWLKVSHNAKPQAPTIWQEWLTNDGNSIIPGVETESKYMGDAEFGAWPEWATAKSAEGYNINWRGDRTGEICAWALTMGRNFQPSVINDDSDRARPFPADIEEEPGNESNHVFAVHCTEINPVSTDDAGSVAWANQFWIQSPKAWKEGEQIKIMFRYKASKAVSAGTQIHKQHPSDYLHWQAVGDVAFTTEWQQFEKVITFDGSMATGWSLAFNLNSDEANGRTAPIDFYFDDLQWMTMKLEDGFFVAGSNSQAGLEYDFANAIPFEPVEGVDGLYTATIGEVGKKDTYVSEIMVSTVRGNDAAFKANTLKPESAVTASDPEDFKNYTAASLAKIKLPMAGVWTILLSPSYGAMSFECLEGEAIVLDDIVTNASAIVVNGAAREDLKDEWDAQNSSVKVREDADPGDNPSDEHGLGGEGHNGQTWDNQFFIVANRTLAKGEITHLKFSYKANKAAKTSTQCHGNPGAYMHWACIGDVNFTTEWQTFDQNFTVPNEADGMQTIGFNMAEIREACDYEIKDVQWYIPSDQEGKTEENLINATGTDNFWVKIGAGTSPYQYTGATGISTVASKKNAGSAVIYNLAGQRVSNSFKGIVVKDGKKMVNK